MLVFNIILLVYLQVARVFPINDIDLLALTFLNPIPALIGGAITIPLLIMLYILKLRRREVVISSTIFWYRALEDLQANTLFQRLRPTWLLLWQLLILLLILTAIARPTGGDKSGTDSQRTILLIDSSASMQTLNETGGTVSRMDQAKLIAHDIVDQLSRSRGVKDIMVIAVASKPVQICSWTSNSSTLHRAIEALDSIDGEGLLEPALQLAQAYALEVSGTDSEAVDENNNQITTTRVIIISDGRFADKEAIFVNDKITLEYISVEPQIQDNAEKEKEEREGERAESDFDENKAEAAGDNLKTWDNVGIINISAQRDYTDPANVELLCVLANSDIREHVVAVRLDVDNEKVETKTVAVPATKPGAEIPTEVSVRFKFYSAASSLVRVSHSHKDRLTVDNAAGMVLQPPKRSSAIIVSEHGRANPFIVEILDLLELRELNQMSYGEYINSVVNPENSEGNGNENIQYELVVFDGIAPEFIPPYPTLSFGSMPPFNDVYLIDTNTNDDSGSETDTDTDDNNNNPGPAKPLARILSWERDHPVLDNVNLDSLVYSDTRRLVFSEYDTDNILAYAPDGKGVIGTVETGGNRHIVVAFDLMNSNWPISGVSFPIFMQNAVDYLTLRGSAEVGIWIKANQSYVINTLQSSAISRIDVTGPGIENKITLNVEPAASEDNNLETILPPLSRVGVYTITNTNPPQNYVVVNLLSDIESDIRPVEQLEIGTEAITRKAARQTVTQELWHWFILAAIAMMALEWLIYTRKAMI